MLTCHPLLLAVFQGDGCLHGLRAVDLSSDQRPMREDERHRILQQVGLHICWINDSARPGVPLIS